MTTSKKETVLDWAANFIGLAGGIPAIAEKISRFWGVLPPNVQEQISQKVPGFLGLSKADEQIFNSLLAKLTIEEQREISNFLFTKCQKFQRDSFRVIVAGMEVVQGAPQIIEKKWNNNAKAFEEKTTSKKRNEDLRLVFLKRFAAYIQKYGLDETYNACIATNMFASHSTIQDIKHSFGAGGKETAKQALRVALANRRRR